MKNIGLLDCTLRDGGSLNKGLFGSESIFNVLSILNQSGVDFVEVGFLDNNVKSSPNSSIFSDVQTIDSYLKNVSDKKSKFVAMIDFSKYDFSNFNISTSQYLYGFRFMFKKSNIKEVLKYSDIVMKLGYSVILNPVSITSYSKEEIYYLIEKSNLIKPKALYIVDTYGLLNKKETLEYYNIFDKYLNPEIAIGYHSHNNMQLAYSNSVEIIENNSNRELIIDSSLLGMGKRAGNLPTELITQFMNSNYAKKYDLLLILNLIQSDILKLKEKYDWGYSLIHYFAAINKCHSDYVSYLFNEKGFNLSEISVFLEHLDYDKKLIFDKIYIDDVINKYSKAMSRRN